MLVGACEVAVETAFELTRTEGAIMLARRFAGKNIVELRAIGAANGMDVIRSFHAAFELEGAGLRGGAGVAGRWCNYRAGRGRVRVRGWEQPVPRRRGPHRETARLGAHPRLAGSSAQAKLQLTEPGVTKTDGAVAKNLKIEVSTLEISSISSSENSREAIAIQAPSRHQAAHRACREHSPARRNIGLTGASSVLTSKKKAPVLNDKRRRLRLRSGG